MLAKLVWKTKLSMHTSVGHADPSGVNVFQSEAFIFEGLAVYAPAARTVAFDDISTFENQISEITQRIDWLISQHKSNE